MKSVAIIGAGPAGMAAATELSLQGFDVYLLDEQPSLGGQIYRNVEHNTEQVSSVLGHDYTFGRTLTDSVRSQIKRGHIHYIPNAVVWSISEQRVVNWRVASDTFSQRFDYLLLATGAIERPTPIPGWTLPRVMTAGGAQILLKNGGVALEDGILIGSGPLLYLLAFQLTAFGKKPIALVETQTLTDTIKALPWLRLNKVALKILLKGLKMIFNLQLKGVRRYTGILNPVVESNDKGCSVSFVHRGQTIKLQGQHVFLHSGVIPNTQLTRSIDIPHHWDEDNACFVPTVDETGKADGCDHIWIAGDGAKIFGAESAALTGLVAADAIAAATNPTKAKREERLKQLKSSISIRAFLDRAYLPPSWLLSPVGETIICRCEEVTAQEIKQAIDDGAHGPNQAKAFTRCGMGNCQGRYCGPTVTNLFAHYQKKMQADVGYYRIRSPIKPITLSELANHEFKQD